MLKCLTCDREYDGPLNEGWCVICTIENLKLNGIHCSIKEAISMGPAIINNPNLIVKLVIK